MSIEAVGSQERADISEAMGRFDSDIAGVTKFDEIPVGTDAVVEAQDYKNAETDQSVTDYAQAGPEKMLDKNAVAQQFDGSGAIVNRYI